MIKNYFKIAWRNLVRNKIHSLQNIIGLAIGLAIVLLSIVYVLDELGYDKFYNNAGRIYRVNTDVKIGDQEVLTAQSSDVVGPLLKNNFPQVESYVRIFTTSNSFKIKKGNEFLKESNACFADSSLFTVFSLPVIESTTPILLAVPNAVIITQSVAKKYFGNKKAVGEILEMDEIVHSKQKKGNYKIEAVIADFPQNTHFKFDFIFPAANLEYSWNRNYAGNYFSTYVLLNKVADFQLINQQLRELTKKDMYPTVSKQRGINSNWDDFVKAGNKLQYQLFPMTDIHLYSNREGEISQNSNIRIMYILIGLVLFVLLMACVNFVNLSTAHAMKRTREIGVRKIMGSGRRSLMLQFLAESVLTVMFAMAIALVIATVILPYFNTLLSKEISSADFFKMPVLVAILFLILIVGILAGSYPAFLLSGFKVTHVLQGQHSEKMGGSALRKSLIVFQFIVSIVLTIGTITVYHQLSHIQEVDIGYTKEQVLVINNIGTLGDNREAFKNEASRIPGIIAASITGSLPVNSSTMEGPFSKDVTKQKEAAIPLRNWWVDDGYLKTMNITLVAGRNFSNISSQNFRMVILNEEAVKMLGLADPIGKKIFADDTLGFTVTGVVKNFNFESLREKVRPLLMSYTDGRSANLAAFRFAAGADIVGIVKEINNTWQVLSLGEPLDFYFLDDAFTKVYHSDLVTGKIGLAVSILAILIACAGLFGMIAYTAQRRTKEIGIRKVLGASVSGIIRMLSKDFILLVFIAFIIASPIAWWIMSEWLEDFAYRIELKWWIFALAGCAALFIALVTVSFQAIKAAIANPVKSLRTE